MMPPSLRIAHVQPIAFDLFGHKDEDWGTAVRYFLSNIAASQVAHGDRPTVHLLTSSRSKQMNVDGIEIHFHSCMQLPRSYPVTARFGRQLSMSMINALRRGEADIIHFHGACSLHAMYGAVAWRAKRQRIPLVSQDHGPRRGKWLENCLLRYGFRNTQVLLAANHESKNTLQHLNAVRAPVYIQPNGYDPKLYYPKDRAQRTPEGLFSILVVSRLWEDKDPITMAHGISALANRHRNIQLTVIGQGLLRREVENELRGAPLRVNFMEHVPQEKLADHYRAADVFVLTSLREGWNQATMEAMACGLPVVATDIPGIRDGVADAGILIPTQRPDQLANALERLLLHPEEGTRYRELGLRRSAMFTWDSVTMALRRVYRRCIDAEVPQEQELDGPAVDARSTSSQVHPVRL
jgi:glycosyltransferase involved in cell wall biosynthesis